MERLEWQLCAKGEAGTVTNPELEKLIQQYLGFWCVTIRGRTCVRMPFSADIYTTTIKLGDNQEQILNILWDKDPVVLIGEDEHLPLNQANFFSVLWMEAMQGWTRVLKGGKSDDV